MPWYLRDINCISYDQRNFDQVVETIIGIVQTRANPLDAPSSKVPKRLTKLVHSGTRFVDVPSEPMPAISEFIYCELKMRETRQSFVFRASSQMPVGHAAEYLARELLPQFRDKDYEWTFIHKKKTMPEYHTFDTSGIRSGDTVHLSGNHRRPRVMPCAT